MTAKQTNPFVLPGLGQGPELAGNPLLASMEMMRQAWAGLAGPGGLAQAMPMAPLNLQDLERRIAELRTVENWLKLNLSMLSSTIQGLEVQRATIATLRSFVGSVAGYEPAAGADASPLEVALGLKPGKVSSRPSAGDAGADDPAQVPPMSDPAPQGPAGPSAASGESRGAGEPGADAASEQTAATGMGAMGAAAQSASQAWWNLLQQQFDQIASATAASMPGAGAAPQGEPARAGAPTKPAAAAKRSAPRKRAAKPAKAPQSANPGKGAKPAS